MVHFFHVLPEQIEFRDETFWSTTLALQLLLLIFDLIAIPLWMHILGHQKRVGGDIIHEQVLC